MTYQIAQLPNREEIGALAELAQALNDSGLWRARQGVPELMSKVLMGRELGMSPIQSLNDIHVIEGKPSCSAHAIAQKIASHPLYKYRVREHTDQLCSIEFFEREDGQPWESVGTYAYTIDDAKRAGLTGKKNWQTHPKAMLFARAISQGYRALIPAVFAMQVYETDEAEEIRDAQGVEVRDAAPATQVDFGGQPDQRDPYQRVAPELLKQAQQLAGLLGVEDVLAKAVEQGKVPGFVAWAEDEMKRQADADAAKDEATVEPDDAWDESEFERGVSMARQLGSREAEDDLGQARAERDHRMLAEILTNLEKALAEAQPRRSGGLPQPARRS